MRANASVLVPLLGVVGFAVACGPPPLTGPTADGLGSTQASEDSSSSDDSSSDDSSSEADSSSDDSSSDDSSSDDSSTDDSSTDDSTDTDTDTDTDTGPDPLLVTRLTYVVRTEPPAPALSTPGTQLRMFGRLYLCDDSPCSSHWFVIRELGSSELLLARLGDPYPTDELLAMHGETLDSFLAPLTVAQGDFGNCEPYDAGCEDGTVLQRGAFELSYPDQPTARILSDGQGWAPAGYHVDVSRWLLGDASCQFGVWSGRALIHKTTCTDDCPPPEATLGCDPPLSWQIMDDAGISLQNYDAHGSFDAECTVVAAQMVDEEQLRVDLDCDYSILPDLFNGP